jgi:hypothetical protein
MSAADPEILAQLAGLAGRVSRIDRGDSVGEAQVAIAEIIEFLALLPTEGVSGSGGQEIRRMRADLLREALSSARAAVGALSYALIEAESVARN